MCFDFIFSTNHLKKRIKSILFKTNLNKNQKRFSINFAFFAEQIF
jgi:hypothetical protein